MFLNVPFGYVSAQKVDRIDPPCWWEGMKNDVQLMLYGSNLKDCSVRSLQNGIAVKNVYNADNSNYLFVDIEVRQAGDYALEISSADDKRKIKIPYRIFERHSGSAERKGFGREDVIYLIMPDRFVNGDTANDIIVGSPQVFDPSGLETRHGGDLQGIINSLDYLQDLGVTAIWATPLLEDRINYHQYGVTDYYKIDKHFGTNELYREMVSRAHKKGLKVIQDVTPQHCGIDNPWVKNPPFADWLNDLELPEHWEYFSLEAMSDPYISKADRDFTGKTIIYKQMPDMNMSKPFVLKYMAQFSIWWIEYADLDGLRVDTYFYMGEKAKDWTALVREEYPFMGIVGEIWGNEPPVLSYWLKSDDLGMVMDFPLQKAIITDFTNDNAHWGGRMRTIYNLLAEDFVYPDAESSQVVFADNHDTDRLYNMLKKDSSKVKMILTFIATTRGTPQIYYGTEWLFEDDERGGPHKNRKDFVLPKQPTAAQQDVFDHTKKLLNFRKNTPVLHTGKLMHYIPSRGVYTYFRYDDNDCVMIIINASDKAQLIDWERFSERLDKFGGGVDILTGVSVVKGDTVEVASKSSMVISLK
jgi:glycosidase